MRKTKKIMAALLTAAMVIGSLTGCGGGNSATSTNDKGEIAELINAVQPEVVSMTLQELLLTSTSAYRRTVTKVL